MFSWYVWIAVLGAQPIHSKFDNTLKSGTQTKWVWSRQHFFSSFLFSVVFENNPLLKLIKLENKKKIFNVEHWLAHSLVSLTHLHTRPRTTHDLSLSMHTLLVFIRLNTFYLIPLSRTQYTMNVRKMTEIGVSKLAQQHTCTTLHNHIHRSSV